MKRDLESEIRAKLTEYVTGSLSLSDLQEWLAPIIWDIEDSGDSAACDLGYAVELAMAEYSAGHLLENEFIAEIESLVL